jgi:GTPase SAR1 family protein
MTIMPPQTFYSGVDRRKPLNQELLKSLEDQPMERIRELIRRTENSYHNLKSFISNSENERLIERWNDWDRRFSEILEQANRGPEVSISLVGDSGAGKSTLVNALIGVKILPVSTMRACTASICEISYEEGPYNARIEFVPRETWMEEVKQILDDLDDNQNHDEEDSHRAENAHDTKSSLEKLWAVYKPEEDICKNDFDWKNLVEPEEIHRALESGSYEIQSDDINQFRSQIERFIDSKKLFYPIVKSVVIRGPFESLRDGAKIIDLPGINDTNKAREELTKNHLKNCNYIWIVFNMNRTLTKSLCDLMKSDDFLRRIIMDGRADSLSFIGTSSDNLDLEEAIHEFDLDQDATIMEAVYSRNQAVRKEVFNQLQSHALRFGDVSQDSEKGQKLARKLKRSHTFTVSSREFLRLKDKGLAKTNSAVFDDISQTEIPSLIEHLKLISSGNGASALHENLSRRLQTLFDEFNQEVKIQKEMIGTHYETSHLHREEMRAAVKSARTFLHQDLDSIREKLVQDLEACRSVLTEKLNWSVERGKNELNQTVSKWNNLHWSTLKAISRRGGRYNVSIYKYNLTADLTKPILDGIAIAWEEHFSESLAQKLEKSTNHLLGNADKYRDRLINSVSAAAIDSQRTRTSYIDFIKSMEPVLNEILDQTKRSMDKKIQESQRTLHDSINHQVHANMQSAFQEASWESGSGMKKRIIKILSEHSNRIAVVMFNDARDALIDKVRGLNDWLAREFDKMIESVIRYADISERNLVESDTHMTDQDLASQRATIEEFERLLKTLDFVTK